MTASIDGEGHADVCVRIDAEGQLKQVLQPGGAVTKFAYGKVTSDGTSRVTTIDAGGSKSDVVTDARGLETSITDYAGGTTAGIQRTYQYDWEGNVTKEKELEGNYKTFTYDSKGRNTVVKYHKADGTEALLKTAYTYDANDQGHADRRLREEKRQAGSFTDPRSTLGRCTETHEFVYRVGRRREQPLRSPTVSYTYDIEGNVTAAGLTAGARQRTDRPDLRI